MLTHQYRCTYNVGAYETYSTWVDAGLGDNLGFTQNASEAPIPSSPYSISSVSLTESFSPLLGSGCDHVEQYHDPCRLHDNA